MQRPCRVLMTFDLPQRSVHECLAHLMRCTGRRKTWSGHDDCVLDQLTGAQGCLFPYKMTSRFGISHAFLQHGRQQIERGHSIASECKLSA